MLWPRPSSEPKNLTLINIFSVFTWYLIPSVLGFVLTSVFTDYQLPPLEYLVVALISEDDIVYHLMSIVPCIQLLVQWAVCQLRGVHVHVCEGQTWHCVRQRVCVKGVCHICIMTLHTVYCVKYAANQEVISVATTPEACAEGLYWMQVPGVDVDEKDHFLMEALGV